MMHAIGEDYDAAAAMLQRGEFLRQLREMERADEEERARESANDNSNGDDGGENDVSTLDYSSYLRDQTYYDDWKHANYRFIDFSRYVGDRQLIVEQDRTVGKGGFVWDAGFILGEHLIQAMRPDAGKAMTVIELGAGTGVSGLMAASAFPHCQVHLTDLPQLVPLLEANSKTFPNASAGVLEWGKTSLTNSPKYDYIIGADVVASIYDSTGLANTIYDLSHERTKIHLSVRDRLAGSIETFEGHLRRLFFKVERQKAVSANKNPDCWILHVSGKRSTQ